MSPAIRLNSIVKIYTRGKQKVEVLHGLSLDIEQGEFVSIMGPSGSGKTTLLNLIAGLDTPTSGELAVAGERIDRLSSRQLRPGGHATSVSCFSSITCCRCSPRARNVEVPLLLTPLTATQRQRTRRRRAAIGGTRRSCRT